MELQHRIEAGIAKQFHFEGIDFVFRARRHRHRCTHSPLPLRCANDQEQSRPMDENRSAQLKPREACAFYDTRLPGDLVPKPGDGPNETEIT
ncbi:hypothetical protein N7539_000134 [Penicillium diatomitis]|uniref:Uncharacterized protein n=1 Tax=Penicillium diatomitis TaxID=2819901 RepID=A0A9W9XL71_9EURO|nr:uncharacterized protein N7539_000134 [Penicillium diatomitis]KAJ5495018.1 hypothetical protein N7539_000134 [Penicillium diatomitis]